ncbi:hypothetical protein [Paenibacillus macquariensis]|nr:hypothetical protein [Paenibacillus macquariensis]
MARMITSQIYLQCALPVTQINHVHWTWLICVTAYRSTVIIFKGS